MTNIDAPDDRHDPTSRERVLVVILGPTGSGKTAVSIALAKWLNAPIISTDSRQIFRGMSIGTAQPSAEELAEAEHHFIAEIDPSDSFTAGEYEKRALERLEELFVRSRTVIAVGGSGLYIDALCRGLDALPTADEQVREQLRKQLETEGLEALVEELQRLDPDYYHTVDKRNPARVMRALEVCRTSHRPYSQQRSGQHAERNFTIVKIGIDSQREELYQRIDERVEAMMAAGLEQEARALYPQRHLNALQTVGYRELFDFFDGKTDLNTAVDLIKRNTRRYAKRQMTWWRRDAEIVWFDRKNIDSMENFIKKFGG